jgi:hypothetical protein
MPQIYLNIMSNFPIDSIGDYLVIYDVNNNAQLVTVYKVGHQRDVCRDLLG